MTTLDPTFAGIKMDILRQALPEVKRVFAQAKEILKTNTPMKSHNLLNHVEEEEPSIQGDSIVGGLSIDESQVPYVNFVEWGNGRAFFYHKDGKTYWQSHQGAQMFARTQLRVNDLLFDVFS